MTAAALHRRISVASLSTRRIKISQCHLVNANHPFSSTTTTPTTTGQDDFSDRCNLNIVKSPYPAIANGPHHPVFEFVTQNWKAQQGGYLDDKISVLDISTGLQRTFADHHHTATGVAASLREDFDVKQDGCVALYSPNHVDYLGVTLGVALAGTKCTPVSPLYTQDELCRVLDASSSTVLFAHTSVLDTALKAAQSSTSIKHVVAITNDDMETTEIPHGVEVLNMIKDHTMSFNETNKDIHRKTDLHPFWLPYSSGTTGLPKGVCLTHNNIVSNLLQLDEIEGIGLPADHKIISPLPFYHIYAFLYSMLYSAWKGNTLVTSSGRFDLEQFCQAVQEHRPQRAHVVPPIVLGLGKSPVANNYDLTSINVMTSAAAPMSEDVEDAVSKKIGCTVKQAWGMSELSPLGTLSSDFNAKENFLSYRHCLVFRETLP